jgi:hypothetical protein
MAQNLNLVRNAIFNTSNVPSPPPPSRCFLSEWVKLTAAGPFNWPFGHERAIFTLERTKDIHTLKMASKNAEWQTSQQHSFNPHLDTHSTGIRRNKINGKNKYIAFRGVQNTHIRLTLSRWFSRHFSPHGWVPAALTNSQWHIFLLVPFLGYIFISPPFVGIFTSPPPPLS